MTFVSFVDRGVSPGGVVMRDVGLSDLFGRPFDGVAGDSSNATWTEIDSSVFPPVPGLQTLLSGEALVEGAPGTLGSGTIFGITADLTKTTEMIVLSLNADAGGLFTRVAVNDTSGFWADALAFADNISGSVGNDSLFSLGGNDVIRGNGGSDVIDGGSGRDLLLGNAGSDLVNGGGGSDRIKGGGGHDHLTGALGNDRIVGAAGRDAIFGGGGRDRMSGGAQEDLLIGGAGNDTLAGGSSADLLSGGKGTDILIGGDGADGFDFSFTDLRGGADRIEDFTPGEDRISLVGFDGLAVVPGTSQIDPEMFVKGRQAADADDRIIWNATTGRLFYDADGTGSADRVTICTMSPATALTAAMVEAFFLAEL